MPLVSNLPCCRLLCMMFTALVTPLWKSWKVVAGKPCFSLLYRTSLRGKRDTRRLEQALQGATEPCWAELQPGKGRGISEGQRMAGISCHHRLKDTRLRLKNNLKIHVFPQNPASNLLSSVSSLLPQRDKKQQQANFCRLTPKPTGQSFKWQPSRPTGNPENAWE